MSPWTLELVIEVLVEHTASIFRAEVSQVGKVVKVFGGGEKEVSICKK